MVKSLTCGFTCIIIITDVVLQAELQRNVFSTGIDLWQGNLTRGREEENFRHLKNWQTIINIM